MTALAHGRQTTRYGQEPLPALYGVGVKASTQVYSGGIACVEAGYATPGRAATGLICLGRFEEDVDNTAGSSGAKIVNILSGVFKWANSTSTDEITIADLGKVCYIVDDQTVAKTSNSSARSFAGMVVGVDTDGVWVLTGYITSARAVASSTANGLMSSTDKTKLDSIQTGSGALSSGVLTVSTGVVITASSRVYATQSTAGGTFAPTLRAAAADMTVGVAGTGGFVIRALKTDGTAETGCTATVNWLVVN